MNTLGRQKGACFAAQQEGTPVIARPIEISNTASPGAQTLDRDGAPTEPSKGEP